MQKKRSPLIFKPYFIAVNLDITPLIDQFCDWRFQYWMTFHQRWKCCQIPVRRDHPKSLPTCHLVTSPPRHLSTLKIIQLDPRSGHGTWNVGIKNLWSEYCLTLHSLELAPSQALTLDLYFTFRPPMHQVWLTRVKIQNVNPSNWFVYFPLMLDWSLTVFLGPATELTSRKLQRRKILEKKLVKSFNNFHEIQTYFVSLLLPEFEFPKWETLVDHWSQVIKWSVSVRPVRL